jgi:hypothetical protein
MVVSLADASTQDAVKIASMATKKHRIARPLELECRRIAEPAAIAIEQSDRINLRGIVDELASHRSFSPHFRPSQAREPFLPASTVSNLECALGGSRAGAVTK